MSDDFEGGGRGPTSAELNEKAQRCRRLAAGITDKQAAEALTGLARGYQDAADRMTARG